MKAYLILEDGHVFTGTSIGSRRETISEIVFNTSMTGYLEVLTDPSYSGQAVCMTYPLIGNYGITYSDQESLRPWLDGFIVRELSRMPSNFRCQDDIQKYLKRFDLPGIAGIDTRALTRILRESGTMNGMITTHEYTDLSEVLPRIKAYKTGNEVEEVTITEPEFWKATDTRIGSISSPAYAEVNPHALAAGKAAGRHYKVAVVDFGVKYNIVRSLNQRGCDVTVYPAWTPAEEILAADPDGIMLTNGPGDPKDCPTEIEQVRKLYESDVPIFAICLGHQLMALATGSDTKKMKYGHRGGNHPVKDLENGRVYITSQNHGYVVDTDTVKPEIAVPAYVNVNDKTNEGLKYVGKNIFTTQFHPEACPGPQDSSYLFDKFIKMMGGEESCQEI